MNNNKTEITYLTGDATEPSKVSEHKLIVHICNNVGRWGKGFVLCVSDKWEEPERRYRQAYQYVDHKGKTLPLGMVQRVGVEEDTEVINMIAQRGIGSTGVRVDYEALADCLQQVKEIAIRESDASVHMPRIGCGLGGGDWDTVESIVKEQLCEHGVPVYVYSLPQKDIDETAKFAIIKEMLFQLRKLLR